MKIVILAAGEGRRMREMFPDTPKALIPVDGKPIAERLIEQYRDFDVLLNVKAEDAERFEYLGVPLLIENFPLGNAGAIKHFIKDLGETFIATHADVYSDLNPKELVAAHKSIATMTVKDMSEAKNFGVITYEGGLVTGFTRERLINCGIYVFSKEVASYIGEGFQDFDKDLFPKLIADRKLRFYKHQGLWDDMGRVDYWNKKMELNTKFE